MFYYSNLFKYYDVIDNELKSIYGQDCSARPVTIESKGDSKVITIEVPGFSKSDISMKVKKDVLEIKGNKNGRKISHAFSIEGYDAKGIDASLKDGMLEITLIPAKSEDAFDVKIN